MLRFVGILVSAIMASLAIPAVQAFEPVDVVAAAAPIHLTVLGTYRGDVFSENTPATPPAYDVVNRRLFVGSVDRATVEVLDVSNPARPTKVAVIDLHPYGVPFSLGIDRGVLAVAVRDVGRQVQFGRLLLYRVCAAQPDLITEPIELPAPGAVAFTPDGRRLIVLLPGGSDSTYVRDPEAGIAIIDLGRDHRQFCRHSMGNFHLKPSIQIVGFERFNQSKDALVAAGVRIYGLNNPTVAQDLDPEELAISPDSTRAWVTLQTNNAIAEIDLVHARVVNLYPLGTKDHSVSGNGFDASDADGINIRNWPVKSFYMPDNIATTRKGASIYLITANEGDPKDFDVYSEKIRVDNPAYILDPIRFPDALLLKQPNMIGPLQVTKFDGDTDKDGDFDQIFLPGARSFSVWTSQGKLVFDSGDAFEQITARAVPTFFNTQEDINLLDARSDDRGPEPERVVVGQIGRRSFAFIDFERIGGIIVYDVTEPRTPRFVQYINNRNFALDPRVECPGKGQAMTAQCIRVGDLEPEGLTFIAARESPIGVPLLVAIHELSDSTTLYRIDGISRGR